MPDLIPNVSANMSAKSVHKWCRRKCLQNKDLRERDTRVELVSQPWEGWARPVYQSRKLSQTDSPHLIFACSKLLESLLVLR